MATSMKAIEKIKLNPEPCNHAVCISSNSIKTAYFLRVHWFVHTLYLMLQMYSVTVYIRAS